MFWGDNPLAYDETAASYKKWKIYFDIFLLIRDARYGNLLHLPFDTDAFEQPSKTTSVITTIQSLYIEKLMEDQEKAFKK